MSIITGIIKDKSGNQLRPLTSAAQVEVEEGQRLDAWIEEFDAAVSSVSDILDEGGKIKATALPDIVNKFKGSFADSEALPESGEAGDYAICNDTDTVWVWDEEKNGSAGWIDTGKKGNVTSVNSKTGDVVIAISDIDGLQGAIDAKVATADIVDNVTSEDTGKPLSANQGKVLNDLITTVQGTASGAESAAAAAQSAAEAASTAATTAQTTASSAAEAAAEAKSAADGAAEEAAKLDFAIVENGEGAPEALRDGGIYFEKDAASEEGE